jgi:serine/threonine protein kinase
MQGTESTLFQWRLSDLVPGLKNFSISSQGNLSTYQHNGQEYVIKVRPNLSAVQREIEFLQAAADISVEVKGYIRRNKTNDDLLGFVMPRLKVIEAAGMTMDEKVILFRQIRDLVTSLHDRHHIIHGDIKLSNMLLDGDDAKLCDSGCAAWMTETVYPTELSIRYASPYRLSSNDNNPRPLIPEEDLYASGVAVWELFVGETPLAPYVSDDEEFELWDKIVDGLKVDVDRIEFEEARVYVKECLSIESLKNNGRTSTKETGLVNSNPSVEE